jgi:hypothetical protein
MVRLSERDFAASSLSVRQAFVEAHRAYKGLPGPRTEPMSILWDGRDIITGDRFAVPGSGRFRIDFLTARAGLRQGVDVEIPGGGVRLDDGGTVGALRTWCDPDRGSVEYDFDSPRGLLWATTVAEVVRGSRTVIERWTGNAAMWVERTGPDSRTYHCSHVDSSPPDFTDLVFALTVSGPG